VKALQDEELVARKFTISFAIAVGEIIPNITYFLTDSCSAKVSLLSSR
jgi:hypothetical protein